MLGWLKQTFFGANTTNARSVKENIQNKELLNEEGKDISDKEMAESAFGQGSNTAKQFGK